LLPPLLPHGRERLTWPLVRAAQLKGPRDQRILGLMRGTYEPKTLVVEVIDPAHPCRYYTTPDERVRCGLLRHLLLPLLLPRSLAGACDRASFVRHSRCAPLRRSLRTSPSWSTAAR
jgi:hypothetical protein